MNFESMGNARPASPHEAMAKIMAIQGQAEVMGANDYEPSAFKRIQTRLEDGEITPEEAVREAEGILGNKQDYH